MRGPLLLLWCIFQCCFDFDALRHVVRGSLGLLKLRAQISGIAPMWSFVECFEPVPLVFLPVLNTLCRPALWSSASDSSCLWALKVLSRDPALIVAL